MGEENSPPITERIAYRGKKSKTQSVCFNNKTGRVVLNVPLKYIPSGGQGLKKRKA